MRRRRSSCSRCARRCGRRAPRCRRSAGCGAPTACAAPCARSSTSPSEPGRCGAAAPYAVTCVAPHVVAPKRLAAVRSALWGVLLRSAVSLSDLRARLRPARAPDAGARVLPGPGGHHPFAGGRAGHAAARRRGGSRSGRGATQGSGGGGARGGCSAACRGRLRRGCGHSRRARRAGVAPAGGVACRGSAFRRAHSQRRLCAYIAPGSCRRFLSL